MNGQSNETSIMDQFLGPQWKYVYVMFRNTSVSVSIGGNFRRALSCPIARCASTSLLRTVHARNRCCKISEKVRISCPISGSRLVAVGAGSFNWEGVRLEGAILEQKSYDDRKKAGGIMEAGECSQSFEESCGRLMSSYYGEGCRSVRSCPPALSFCSADSSSRKAICFASEERQTEKTRGRANEGKNCFMMNGSNSPDHSQG